MTHQPLQYVFWLSNLRWIFVNPRALKMRQHNLVAYVAARAFLHDQNTVRQVDGLERVVRDKQHRSPIGLPQGQQFLAHAARCQFIKRAEWFIHQQDFRLDRKSPRDGSTLLHAARKLQRIEIGKPL